jgi:hypothetical protein
VLGVGSEPGSLLLNDHVNSDCLTPDTADPQRGGDWVRI